MPKNSIKEGVKIDNIRAEMAMAYCIACSIFNHYGYECILTSGVEGVHSAKSYHRPWIALAIDLRKSHIQEFHMKGLLASLRSCLGSQFQVVNEATHIHIEFEPKYPPEA